jgi:hypothetical protein
MITHGLYKWIASPAAFSLSSPRMAATFTALRARAQRNHRVSKAASVGGLFAARYLGYAKKLSEVLAQCLNASIREKLMQPLTALIPAASALRRGQLKNMALAVG